MHEKSNDYYSAIRTEIVPLIDRKPPLTLDVGCGAGATSSHLKSTGHLAQVHGIEVIAEAADQAASKLDQVIRFDLNSKEALPLQKSQYDLVLALDVLEHLIDPWKRLKELAQCLKPGGSAIISVPNIRNFRVVLPLILRGRFEYAESGILDSTHLRFFTRASAIRLVERSGLQVELVEQTGRKPGSISFFANLLTLGIFRSFFDIQYLIRARKA